MFFIFLKSEVYDKYSKVLKDNLFNKQVVFFIVNIELVVELFDKIVFDVQLVVGLLLIVFKIFFESDENVLFWYFVMNFFVFIDFGYYCYLDGCIYFDIIYVFVE